VSCEPRSPAGAEPAAVLVLRAGGLSYAEVAQALGVGTGQIGNFAETRRSSAAQGGHPWLIYLKELCAGLSTTGRSHQLAGSTMRLRRLPDPDAGMADDARAVATMLSGPELEPDVVSAFNRVQAAPAAKPRSFQLADPAALRGRCSPAWPPPRSSWPWCHAFRQRLAAVPAKDG